MNAGFSAACNKAAALARKPFLVFLNPDTIVSDGWIEKLLSRLNERVKASGPISNFAAGGQDSKLYNRFPLAGTVQIDVAARAYDDWWSGKSVATKLLIGFCLATERAAFESVGGFDERFFLGNEDLDYCWQLTLRGFGMVIVPDVFVYHSGHESFSPQAERLVAESTRELLGKLDEHYGQGNAPAHQEIWGIDLIRPGSPSSKEDSSR